MFRYLKINESEHRLSLVYTPIGLALPFNKILLLMVIACFAMLSVSVNLMLSVLGLIVFLGIAVITKTPGLRKNLDNWRNGYGFHFDKFKNELVINGRIKHSLSDISGLEINHDRSYDSNQIYLDLRLFVGDRIRLLETNSYREYKAVGRQIARFCEVEFWDNAPGERELLWGATRLSNKDIATMNERNRQFD